MSTKNWFTQKDLKLGCLCKLEKNSAIYVYVGQELEDIGLLTLMKMPKSVDTMTGMCLVDDCIFTTTTTFDQIEEIRMLDSFFSFSGVALENLWKDALVVYKKPKEVVLSMQEIADKFNIPVEELKIKK